MEETSATKKLKETIKIEDDDNSGFVTKGKLTTPKRKRELEDDADQEVPSACKSAKTTQEKLVKSSSQSQFALLYDSWRRVVTLRTPENAEKDLEVSQTPGTCSAETTRFDVHSQSKEDMEAQYERIAKTERKSIALGLNPMCLFVRGLLRRITTVEQLKEVFPKCAEVNYTSNRTTAIVTFSTAADAEEAFLTSVDKIINDQTIVVTYHFLAAEGVKHAKLHEDLIEEHFNRSFKLALSRYVHGVNKLRLLVKCMPKSTSEEELRKAFPKSKKIYLTLTGCKGQVTFDNETDAKEALDSSVDMIINKQKVAVLYDSYHPPRPKAAEKAEISAPKKEIKISAPKKEIKVPKTTVIKAVTKGPAQKAKKVSQPKHEVDDQRMDAQKARTNKSEREMLTFSLDEEIKNLKHKKNADIYALDEEIKTLKNKKITETLALNEKLKTLKNKKITETLALNEKLKKLKLERYRLILSQNRRKLRRRKKGRGGMKLK